MHFAILGTGDVGKALAHGLHRHGHTITMGTRDPAAGKLDDWLAQHDGIRLATFADAAAVADAAILAVGWGAAEAVCHAIAPHVADRLVIDVTNPLASSGDGPPILAVAGDDSGGEQVQRWLPHAKAVKCWNIVGNPHMVDPDLDGAPTMFIAGDDSSAKAQVTDVLAQVGWPDTVDLGGMDSSRYLEPLAMVWIRTYFATGSGDMAIGLVRGRD